MNVKLDVTGITRKNAREKYLKAIEALADSMEVDVLCKSRPHGERLLPVLDSIMQHYINKINKRLRNTMTGLAKYYGLKLKKAVDDNEPFTIQGKPVWNPSTGIPMTKKEWMELSGQLDTYLGNAADEYGLQLASESTVAGIMESMIPERQAELEKMTREQLLKEHEKMLSGPPSDFQKWLKANDMSEADYRISMYNLDRCADYCTDMADDVKSSIHNLFNVATLDGWDNWRIGQAMFDQYADLNKDWDRILRTETNDAYSDGYIQGEAAKDPGEEIYFIGRSKADACPICKRDINGVIVKYSNKPLDDENIEGDPITNLAIWAGKSSVGHGAKESYAVITRHPSCSCRWVRHIPE